MKYYLILFFLYITLSLSAPTKAIAQQTTIPSKLTSAQIQKIQEISVRIDKYKTDSNRMRLKLLRILNEIRGQLDVAEGFSDENSVKLDQIESNLNDASSDITNLQLVIVLEGSSTTADLTNSIDKLKLEVRKINAFLKTSKDELKSVLTTIKSS